MGCKITPEKQVNIFIEKYVLTFYKFGNIFKNFLLPGDKFFEQEIEVGNILLFYYKPYYFNMGMSQEATTSLTMDR